MTITNKVVELSNVSPDFISITQALQTNLKNTGSWTDMYAESTGQTLIEYGAAFTIMDQWAIEKSFKEAFIQTATTDTAIYSAARFLGVRMNRKLPGVQTGNLTRVNNYNQPLNQLLQIPAYSQFSVANSIPFFNRSAINFINYAATVNNVYLCQGQVYTKTYISDGSAFQQITISGTQPFAISDTDVRVTINGVDWNIIQDGLWHYGMGDMVVADSTLGNGDLILQFGNGIYGQIPPQGSDIVVTYAETLGAAQGLIAANSSISLTMQYNGYSISGQVVQSSAVTLVDTSLSALSVVLSSNTEATPTAYLLAGNVWSTSYVGLQFEDSKGGLGLISGVDGNAAKLHIVNKFGSTLIPSGSWTLSIPSVGQDQHPAIYYKVLAPSMSRAQSRCVTSEDFTSEILRYPGISDVLVRTEKDLIRNVTINKSAATIATEKANGVYTGVDTYSIVVDTNVALYNAVWISFLTTSGIQFTTNQNDAFLAWLQNISFVGSQLRLQTCVKNIINIEIVLYCLPTADTDATKVMCESAISSMFSTTQPMLSRMVAVSDIYTTLHSTLANSIDYFELYTLKDVNGVLVRQAISDFVPTNADIDSVTGFPIPPGYLYLNNLVISSEITKR